MPTTVVSWNISKGHEPWRRLLQMDADIALLQEVGSVPPHVLGKVDTGPVEHWDSHVWNSRWYEGKFKDLFDRWPMVVKLSDRVEVEWFKHADTRANVHSHTSTHANANPSARANAHTSQHADGYTNPRARANASQHADGYTNPRARANANQHADGYTNPRARANANPSAHAHAGTRRSGRD